MWKTIAIVPSSLRSDPQVQAACEAIDRQLTEIYRDIPDVAFWPNLDKQKSPLLDVLMWEYHVDVLQMLIKGEAEVPLTDELKRTLIDQSILWHQKKGTPWIIKTALATLFEKIDIAEWFEYGGDPYFFKIIVSSALNDPGLYKKVVQVIMELKNVRSWFEFIIAKVSELYLWEAEAKIRRIHTQIYMLAKPTEVEGNVWVGVSMCIYKIIIIEAGS